MDAGISKSLVTKWKGNGTELPSPDVIKKLSNYFCISVSEVLGAETKKEPLTVFGEELPEDVLQNEKVLRAMKAFMQVPPELQDHVLATIEGLAESRK
jgi:hypothetical protein